MTIGPADGGLTQESQKRHLGRFVDIKDVATPEHVEALAPTHGVCKLRKSRHNRPARLAGEGVDEVVPVVGS